MKPLYWLTSICCCMLAIPAAATPTFPSLTESDHQQGIFSINVDVAQRPAEAAVLVRDNRSGYQTDFDEWLLPLDAVLAALALDVSWLDGVWVVRSPDGRTINLDPKTLQTDLELGLVISAQDIETLFGVPVTFDPHSQTVRFSPPWQAPKTAEQDIHPHFIPKITAPDFTVTAIRQQTRINSRWDAASLQDRTDYDGELTALGSFLGGSWFVRTEQRDLAEDTTWRLREAQYLYQTDFADFVVGSQPTFWHSQSHKDYLGITTVRRWGFTPPPKTGRNGFQPTQRLEAKAAVPGLLPGGASALIVTGGVDREMLHKDSNFLGQLEDFQGGLSFRHGVSEGLTVGTGIVYEDSLKGVGELFVSAADFPFQMQVSALSNAQSVEINSTVRLAAWQLELNYDNKDLDVNLNWELLPGLALAATGKGEELKTGFRFAHSSPEFVTTIEANLNSDRLLLWNLNSRWGPLKLTSHRRQFASNSQLSVNFSEGDSGHRLSFGYETVDRKKRQGDLSTISWHYRSESKPDNQRLWDFEVGYSFGSQGNGLVTSVATNVIPGLGVRLGYQEVSVTSDDPTFKVELVPNFTSSGAASDGSGIEKMRQQGSLRIQPFFDHNNNGKQDFGEKLYLQSNLLLINDQPLQDYQPHRQNNGIFVKLFPDTYRLTVEPTQLPAHWTTASAYEVEVVAGSYTTVLIPLIRLSAPKAQP